MGGMRTEREREGKSEKDEESGNEGVEEGVWGWFQGRRGRVKTRSLVWICKLVKRKVGDGEKSVSGVEK